MTASKGPLPDGSLNIAVELRCAMNKAIGHAEKPRVQIAAEMSALLGVEVTEAMLDSWTAPSRGKWRFPCEYAAAFDEACGTPTLLELLARKRTYVVLDEKEARDAELGRIHREMLTLQRRQRDLLGRSDFERVSP